MSIFLPDAEEKASNSRAIQEKMKIDKIAFEDTNCFSPLFLDYLKQAPGLRPFYNNFPSAENFTKNIDEKNFPDAYREVLYNVLEEQYTPLRCSAAVKQNIEKLRSKRTFTITTGHQLNIFTGPLYFIYKIVACINTANELKTRYPDYDFVPVYWMASEDHDFEEINHFNLFGKQYTWETPQKGPVGKFKPEGLKTILDELPEKVSIFENAYLQSDTLADATRYFVNELFGEDGLIVIDADHRELKKLFAPYIKDELLENKTGKLVHETSERLAAKGYKIQIVPREINLFYMENGLRERIVHEVDFKVLNTSLQFTESEILNLADKSPEKFSPNVVLRPLYQEVILPNIAYVGGPAEIAYWLQLKSIFDQYKLAFPILMPRSFGLVINKANLKKVKKLNLSTKDLFMDFQALKTKYVSENSDNNLSLAKEIEVLKQLYSSVMHKALIVGKSLEGIVGAESTKALKGMENVERKLRKAEEQNQEISIKQIENIKEKLFPGGSLQERKENFLNFYINNPSILNFFINNFKPFDFRFNVIMEDE